MSGIGRCSNDINACHREDQYAREKLDEVIAQRGGRAASQALTPNGPSQAEAKTEGSATRAGARVGVKVGKFIAETTGKEIGKQMAEHAAHKGLAKFARVVSALGFIDKVIEGVKLTTEAHQGAVREAHEQAQREMDGLNRDAMRAFILGGIGDAVSDGYRAHLSRGLSKDGVRVAMAMVTHASVDPGSRYAAEKHVMHAMAKEGIAEAKQLGIESRAGLERALASDARFREHFETSTAFRIGVGAVLYEHGVR